ncbi:MULTISPECIES: FeoA family protein [Loigolactobacillus]|uniref:Ferrous iron transporter FeoA-like domain-containing protein n=1 Tax=Loigolactobacillus backii TaxID=375175 RepID=A0A192H0A6_9LACO|nr:MULTISPECIES: FeoA family protein [Loigolactobacillus]ANK60757.1 hypothetical protein AYR52_11150 [Loigolactobacillus backii]ANK61672.1 hypothetical protein AYR53_02165 [Loigolactobacillus backii]ANK65711.1 hypothetical protein AYR54_10950 [Loigolactobacillus backii]ANK68188.1 hypothetical protein AYR55_11105 [Loigolactobacillus backii]ANK69129.1 hypothetical protein AYR56_02545 [Loigolactobacillus backii]
MFLFKQTPSETFYIHDLTALDEKTQHRLRDLGLTLGKKVKIIRRYPFNGPIIITFDQQRVGLRRQLVAQLKGGTL